MSRADRLFRIIHMLRRKRRPVTAQEIAAEMEASPRTIYRDIAQLMADRVPIRGEAGIGYVLEGGFDMPPLMLTPDEIEAAMLGAQWVMSRADPALARAASDLVAKIGVVIPEHLRPLLMEPALAALTSHPGPVDTIDMERVRTSIRAQGKIALLYRDEETRHLADCRELLGYGAPHCGVVRNAQGLSPFPRRPRAGGDISGGALSHTARPAPGAMEKGNA